MTLRQLEYFFKRNNISFDTPIAIPCYDDSDFIEAESAQVDMMVLELGGPKVKVVILE